jgi:hypothetical protein
MAGKTATTGSKTAVTDAKIYSLFSVKHHTLPVAMG